MASDDESPGSPLSSIESDDLSDDLPPQSHSRDDTISVDSPSVSTPTNHTMRPSKRRRTGAYDRAAGTPLSVATGMDDETLPFVRPTSPADSISSDSSADVPNSPYTNLAAGGKDDDEGIGSGDQVTVCKWTGCAAGDLGNMDALVTHLHDVHMPHRQKKYACEWVDCPRKGSAQASGYALRAHMRSHTREKPFYCALPECDRSFTRSDALAKHMRTVHETEALRPSDPIPKNHSGGPLGAGLGGNNNLKRIKLVFGGKEKSARPGLSTGDLPPLSDHNIDSQPFTLPVPKDYYPLELRSTLSPSELSLPPSQLFRLLRRQIHWAEKEGQSLTRELDDLVSNTSDLLGSSEDPPHTLNPAQKRNLDGTSSTPAIDERSDTVRKMAWKSVQSLIDDVVKGEKEAAEQIKKYDEYAREQLMDALNGENGGEEEKVEEEEEGPRLTVVMSGGDEIMVENGDEAT